MLVFIGGGIGAVVRFLGLTPKERYAKIQGWLLQAVLLAERDYGSGTGKLKLSAVYDKFVEKFQWLAKVTTFDTFSGYVAWNSGHDHWLSFNNFRRNYTDCEPVQENQGNF